MRSSRTPLASGRRVTSSSRQRIRRVRQGGHAARHAGRGSTEGRQHDHHARQPCPSALVSFEVFVRPALRAAMGHPTRAAAPALPALAETLQSPASSGSSAAASICPDSGTVTGERGLHPALAGVVQLPAGDQRGHHRTRCRRRCWCRICKVRRIRRRFPFLRRTDPWQHSTDRRITADGQTPRPPRPVRPAAAALGAILRAARTGHGCRSSCRLGVAGAGLTGFRWLRRAGCADSVNLDVLPASARTPPTRPGLVVALPMGYSC